MGSNETDEESLDCDHIPLFKEEDEEEDEKNDEKQSNGISESMSQKFADLQKRRELLSKRCLQRDEKMEKRKKRRKSSANSSLVTEDEKKKKKKKDDEKEWSSVRQYLDVNSHLHGPIGHGVRQAKCLLEEKINEAIGEGELEVAEQLSDKLATREFGVRAANAFAAKRFERDKQEKKKKMLTNARKKLHWGFETKQRWEMKGNM